MSKIAFFRLIIFIFLGGVVSLQKGFSQDYNNRISSLTNTVNILTSDSLGCRKFGSEGERNAAIYLYEKLKEYGVIMITPQSGEDFLYITPEGDTITSRNVVGIVEGYDSLLKNEYVVVGAYYDNLGDIVLKKDGKEIIQKYKGADGNLSGVVTLLDVAKQIVNESFRLKRSVIFALFGGGEVGSAGSWYFLNRSFKEIDNIVAMINLEMVGRNKNDNFYYYSADGNMKIAKLINNVSQMPLSLVPKHISQDNKQSDHRNFFEKNIPIILFTTGMHKDYRTVKDTPDKLDYSLMARISDFTTSTIIELANGDRIKTVRLGKESDKIEDSNVYSQGEVEKMATFFKGGEKRFLERWVYHYVKYPEEAIKNGIEGTVIANFIVEKDGTISNLNILKGVCYEIDEEVKRVIEASPKWKAAENKGMPVRVKISLPIEFKLTKKPTFRLKK